MKATLGSASATFALLLLAACVSKQPPEPGEKTEPEAVKPSAAGSAVASSDALTNKRQAEHKALAQHVASTGRTARPVAQVPVSPGDPEAGDFTLAEATAGLKGKGLLVADIATDKGTLTCELYPDKAPITVANFVGLARGLRPWKKGEAWVKAPLYTDNVFHRIIKGFMIQGGDPEKTGKGGPGYAIPDEIWENARHDEMGLLCMANRGPNTNGSQFFIMDDKPAPHLDNSYTIFGKCSPPEVITKLASVKLGGPGAEQPPAIKTIKVRRDPTRQDRLGAAPAPSGEPSAKAALPAPKATAKPAATTAP